MSESPLLLNVAKTKVKSSFVSVASVPNTGKNGASWKERRKNKLQVKRIIAKSNETNENEVKRAEKCTENPIVKRTQKQTEVQENLKVNVLPAVKATAQGEQDSILFAARATAKRRRVVDAKQSTSKISSLFTHNPQVSLSSTPLPVSSSILPTAATHLLDTALSQQIFSPCKISTFKDCGLDAALVQALSNQDPPLIRPTHVQSYAVPVVLGMRPQIMKEDVVDEKLSRIYKLVSRAQAIEGQEDEADASEQDLLAHLDDQGRLTFHDVVIQSQTGSGKTLAYLLPLLHDFLIHPLEKSIPKEAKPTTDENGNKIAQRNQYRAIGTLALILAPTRELARQIFDVLERLVRSIPALARTLVPGLITGGDKRKSEKARLRLGVTVLVATPGRLLDHLTHTQSFNVSQLRYLVLDEADRLMALGFEEKLTEIVKLLKRARKPDIASWKTILCSATLTSNVKRLAGENLKRPLYVYGDNIELTEEVENNKKDEILQRAKESKSESQVATRFNAPQQLQQKCLFVPAKLRLVTLTTLLRSALSATQHSDCKMIVFFACCDAVDFHYQLFGCVSHESDEEKTEFKSLNETTSKSRVLPDCDLYRLHGKRPSEERTRVFKAFQQARHGLLLCSDVAARGLDLPRVTCIVQYDAPSEMSDYVHRIGRTARAGRAGEAWLFLMPHEAPYLDLLTKQRLQISTLQADSLLSAGANRSQTDSVEQGITQCQLNYEQFVLANEKMMSLARQAFLSSVRAYATHAASERHIFHVRQLHLGHFAKSFALREVPSKLGHESQITDMKRLLPERQDTKKWNVKKPAEKRRLPTSSHNEFEAGTAIKRQRI